jgi:DNA modification methylase
MPVNTPTVNESFSLSGGGYSDARNSISRPRHRWYFIKEAFAPGLVQKAMEHAHCTEDCVIIDPFSGSGTVPLVATLAKCRSIGFEVNPFLAFLSKAKLLQVEPTTLAEHAILLTEKASTSEAPFLDGFSTFSSNGKTAKWLFNQQVIRAFKGGWDATVAIQGPARELLRLALLGAAMDSCNATRDGKALRYRRTWQETKYSADDFLTAFKRRTSEMKLDLVECPTESGLSCIISGDSRAKLAEVNTKFHLCVTSPPYLNSFDYTDVYRPELFLGGFLSSQQELRSLRQTTIRSHVQARWQEPIRNDFGTRYTRCITAITAKSNLLWDERIPKMIQAYFEDMYEVLSLLARKAESGASMWLVVSTSAYAGVEVPVDFILADIAVDVGWQLEEIGLLRYIRTSSQHWRKWEGPEGEKPRLRESVVMLRC